LIFLSTQLVFAQADQELDPLLQLGFEYSTEKALAGANSSASLQELRDVYAIKLNDIVTTYQNRGAASGVDNAKAIRDRILMYIDARIRIAKDQENAAASQTGIIHQTITDGANSVDPSAPPEPNPIVTSYQKIHADQLEDHAAHHLHTTVVSQLPDSTSVIQSVSSNVYDFDAGLPPSSSIVAHQDQDDDDAQPTEPPIPTPTVSSILPDTQPQGGSSTVNIQKPVRFSNNGAYAATVVVASYIPPPNASASKSSASTVVFPGGNSSGNLSLPIGEYTFCYYWELDSDADKDGYVDYAHALTGNVTLSATSPDSVESAQVVSLNPENRSSPNGKCGEEAQVPSVDTLDLTPQESANQGAHTYVCSFPEWGEDTFSLEITFTHGGFTMYGFDKVYTFTMLGPNRYTDQNDTVTFTDDGFLAENEAGVLTCILQ
jgi:hypothetical protein